MKMKLGARKTPKFVCSSHSKLCKPFFAVVTFCQSKVQRFSFLYPTCSNFISWMLQMGNVLDQRILETKS